MVAAPGAGRHAQTIAGREAAPLSLPLPSPIRPAVADDSDKTLFQKIADGDIPADLVYEDDRAIAFRDIHPQAPTHLLIVPRKPIPRADAIEPEDEAMVGHLFTVARRVAAQEGLSDYRLVVNNGEGAGQTVFHLHVHLLAGRSLQWPPG